MTLEQCIKSIDNYLSKGDGLPRFVNVDTPDDMRKLVDHYRIGDNVIYSVSDFSGEDESPKIMDLMQKINKSTDDIFLTGFTSWWKLEGETELRQRLKSLMSLSVRGHLVVFCYQCHSFLETQDPRMSRLIYEVEGISQKRPVIVLQNPELQTGREQTVSGIAKLPMEIEKANRDRVVVLTKKRKTSFPHSLFLMEEIDGAYSVLCQRDPSLETLPESLGSQDQWSYALNTLGDRQSWGELVEQEICPPSHLELAADKWFEFTPEEQWLFLLSLKLFPPENNWCLYVATRKANTPKHLIREIVRSLLDVQHNDSDFWDKYICRKKLIEQIKMPDDEVLDYCNVVKSKQSAAIFYLTDLHRAEKELLFEIIAEYPDAYSEDELRGILLHVYPDLASYLAEDHFEIPLLNRYFGLYKYCKVKNQVLPEFEKMMEEQSTEREYNRLLSGRVETLENICPENTFAYFMDAMGVEYLSYIAKKCENLRLMVDISVCRAELPTLTSCNKEFIDLFNQNSIAWSKVSELDEIKHRGAENYTFEGSKYPIHLIRELEIIEQVLKTIKSNLMKGKYDRYILVSDHGASRLAMIYPNSKIIDVNEKGTHGGRVCKRSETLEPVPCATEAGDNYVIANYDRFKGGHATGVEIHGGATLEEITVPVIEIWYQSEDIEIFIPPEPIFVPRRTNPIVTFYSKSKISEVTVKINGEDYETTFVDDTTFTIEMSKRTKAGKYSANVYMKGNQIASDLPFEIEKEGMTEKSLL